MSANQTNKTHHTNTIEANQNNYNKPKQNTTHEHFSNLYKQNKATLSQQIETNENNAEHDETIHKKYTKQINM